jgi:Delta3-Delta2-enoyl-CoA isomerase
VEKWLGMRWLELEERDRLRIVRLARGKGNALNPELVEDLHEAFQQAEADAGVRGVVLASASPSIFCGGFDAMEVFLFGESEIRHFFGRFLDLCRRIVDLPKPVVAAVNGHAMAGGAVLALTCDERVFAEGGYGFALNEINLGMAVTPGIVELTVRAAGAAAARELLLGGDPIPPEKARSLGIASELTPAGALLDRACERCTRYAGKPSEAFAAVKRSLWRGVKEVMERDAEGIDVFVRQWTAPESVERRRAVTDRMRR